MNSVIERLIATCPVVTDGAWGTQLQARGLAVGEYPDAWNLSHSDRVESVARAYVEAGSKVILTNTFGANRLSLARHGLAEQVATINLAGAELSCRAAVDHASVFASMGPSGEMLAMDDISEEQLRDAFAEQAAALQAGGVDGIVIETMSDLTEATLAVAAAHRTGLPVVACMVYDSGAERDRTMMGVTPEQAAEALSTAGADVIGANCGNGIAGYVPICRRLRAATDKPIWIKANAGLPEMVDSRAVYKTAPGEFAAHVPALIEAGANFIGGCCGTTPEHIQAVALAVRV